MDGYHVTVTCLVLCLALFLDWATCAVDSRRNPYDIRDYKKHPCIRTCKEGERPMTCGYYFLVEHYTTLSAACYNCPHKESDCSLPQCVTGAGLHRTVLAVNRMVPGPAVHVCEGDTVEVMVDNRMELGEGTTVHWHGVSQKGTPYMDGTSMITQCPITKWSKMRYRFAADEAGTYFWHSHSALQRSDGLFGSLVVRSPQSKDPHSSLYDMDLPEHTIVLNDWSKEPSADSIVALFHTEDSAHPSGILVNGRARAVGGLQIPYAEFHVKPGFRYRFRVIYSGVLNCPIYIRLDDHKLLMIAADGRDFEPVEVDSFTIYSGERFDFILKAKGEEESPNGSYWMRFKGNNACSSRKIIQAAVLRYDTEGSEDPAGEVTYDNTMPDAHEETLNDRSGVSSEKNLQIVDLKAIGPHGHEPDLVEKPDKKFYIALARSPLPDDRFLTPVYPGCPIPPTDAKSSTTNRHMGAAAVKYNKDSDICKNPTKRYNLQLNYITGRLPPAPPLTQYEDIDKKLLCNGDNIKRDCTKQVCDCVHTLRVGKGELVEILLVNPKAEGKNNISLRSLDSQLIHPMHLHGHSARVVTMLRLNGDITLDALKEMDARGEISRVRSRAPYKDTIPVGDDSIVVIRFRADNPGFWYFHCHIELHTELGMNLVIQSGEVSEMAQPKNRFPKCMNWPIDEEPLEPRLGQDMLDTSWFKGHEDGGCIGLCSNETERKFFTLESLKITGVALLLSLALPATMLGILYYLRKRSQRFRSRYHVVGFDSQSQVGPYSSLRERDETQ